MIAVNLDEVTVSYVSEPVFADLSWEIHDDRCMGLVGPNGAGKSLLFRLILDREAPTSGRIQVGPSVKIGYYAQEHETLDYESTLIDTVRRAARLIEDGAVRFLARFLFSYDQARGLVRDLSGGERSRLQMALLMLSRKPPAGSSGCFKVGSPAGAAGAAGRRVLEPAGGSR